MLAVEITLKKAYNMLMVEVLLYDNGRNITWYHLSERQDHNFYP